MKTELFTKFDINEKKPNIFVKYFKKAKNLIITGTIIIIPSVTTIYLLIKLFGVVDSFVPELLHSILPILPRKYFPGLGLVIFLFFAGFVGLIARNYFGKKMLNLSDKIFTKIPFLNKVYISLQQILDTVIANKKNFFEKVVLIQYPKQGSYSIGFLTSKLEGEIPIKANKILYGVFLTTTPNPTSGFFLILPRSEIVELDMSIEAAVKIVMSGGIINSEHAKQLIDNNKKQSIPK
jgi:uncharacterized membrane protein